MGKKKSVKKRKSVKKKDEAKKRKEEKTDRETPREEAGEKESASGLFKEAIAAFEDAGALSPAGSETRSEPETDAVHDEQEEAETGKGEKEGEAGEDRKEAEEKAAREVEKKGEGEGEKGPADPAKAELGNAGGAEGIREAEEAKEGGGPERAEETEKAGEVGKAEEAEEAEAARHAAPAQDDRMVRKAVRKRGDPDKEIEAYEPKEYEVHGDVVKFECRCGKRVAAPLKAKHSIGKCPKCGVRLVLPRPRRPDDKRSRPTGPRTEAGTEVDKKAHTEASPKTDVSTDEKAQRADAVRQARDDGVLSVSNASPKPPAPTWIMRLVAFQIDLAVPAALFFALFYLLRSLEVEPAVYWTVALAAAGGAWLVAAIALPAAVSGSLGMLMVGLRYRGPDGRPLTFIEAVGRGVTGLAFSPLAPLSLADPGGRTTADLVTGCAVVSVGQEAMGAAPSGRPEIPTDRAAPAHGQAPRPAAAEKRDAPDTVRKRRWEARRGRTKPR